MPIAVDAMHVILPAAHQTRPRSPADLSHISYPRNHPLHFSSNYDNITTCTPLNLSDPEFPATVRAAA